MKLRWVPINYEDFLGPGFQNPEAGIEACLNASWKCLRIPRREAPLVSVFAFGWAGVLELLSEENLETLNETFQEGVEVETLVSSLKLLEELARET